MEYETAEEKIRDKHSHHPSVDDQVFLKRWLVEVRLFASEDEWIRASQVEEQVGDELDYQIQGLLDNLEELNLLAKKDLQGSRNFIRSERKDELYFTPQNEDFRETLTEEITRLIDDIRSDDESTEDHSTLAAFTDGGDEDEEETTLRDIAAEALNVKPDKVEEELRTPPDPIERMQSYDVVVERVEESNEIEENRNYGRLGWRNRANRWALSSAAEKYSDVTVRDL